MCATNFYFLGTLWLKYSNALANTSAAKTPIQSPAKTADKTPAKQTTEKPTRKAPAKKNNDKGKKMSLFISVLILFQ